MERRMFAELLFTREDVENARAAARESDLEHDKLVDLLTRALLARAPDLFDCVKTGKRTNWELVEAAGSHISPFSVW